jgi:DNA repair protein RecO (recombination protein O)
VQRAIATTQAVLLRRTDYRDADLYLVVFTEDFGKLGLLARGARNSRRRFGGALEPLHELQLELSQSEQGFSLMSAQIARYRGTLAAQLDRMQAAARALRWVREVTPEGQPEPEIWSVLSRLLTRLDAVEPMSTSELTTAAGLQLLEALGWGLELDACVRCGKACPEGKASGVDPAQGGLVCSACGGGRFALSGVERSQLKALRDSEEPSALDAESAARALTLVETAFSCHALSGEGRA